MSVFSPCFKLCLGEILLIGRCQDTEVKPQRWEELGATADGARTVIGPDLGSRLEGAVFPCRQGYFHHGISTFAGASSDPDPWMAWPSTFPPFLVRLVGSLLLKCCLYLSSLRCTSLYTNFYPQSKLLELPSELPTSHHTLSHPWKPRRALFPVSLLHAGGISHSYGFLLFHSTLVDPWPGSFLVNYLYLFVPSSVFFPLLLAHSRPFPFSCP
ncbi:hypothetical protein L228DRAFT_24057 [Xylona heveae TC161]|uniref:Uncharacterized protein n=1 Tax=Xylona heveae (strain CBS 132557 / TC161) TaxID=1328760 RepID=A0A165AB34_XYLHT|nr:hypothetical protein L228DRAFT_24057 [Xylona heveae TC161]KZF20195.1 hypothetical protein L228DRAFT_24057 [Xylona heveae TC161]